MAARENHAVPTLRELCRALGDDLAPVVPADVPAVEVSAVHVSELVDPTQYLDGGELLLTTGLEFRTSPQWMRGYVRRISDAGVAGLALGLGPVHTQIPRALVRAADSIGLPLLAVLMAAGIMPTLVTAFVMAAFVIGFVAMRLAVAMAVRAARLLSLRFLRLGQLRQFMLDHRDLVAGEPLDIAQIIALRRIAEGDGDALPARPRGAADAVDIAFRLVGQFEIHHMRDVVDVDAARGDVGCH